MGGGNAKENLAVLTAREHFVAHRLLAKMHPESNKLWYALRCMSTYSKYGRIPSRVYELIRKEYAIRRSAETKGIPTGRIQSAETKEKRAVKNRRKKLSEEHKAKLVQSRRGSKHTEETKAHLSNINKGKKLSRETMAKIRATRAKNGPLKHTDETRAKMSAFRKGRKFSVQERAKRYPNGEGHKHSNETKRKISEVSKGRKVPEERVARMLETKRKTGKLKHSVETKAKISASNKKRCKGIPRPAKYECQCKFCKGGFVSAMTTSCICKECRKPRLCACGQEIKTPGVYVCHKHKRVIRTASSSCLCRVCNTKFYAKSLKCRICPECFKPKLCLCGCGKEIKTPGLYIFKSHAKIKKR